MHLRSALDLDIANSRNEVLTLQSRCPVTSTPSTSDDVLRVVDLDSDFSLLPDATEEQVAQYVAQKATLEASVVAYGLTPDAMDGRFTLDDPCNLLRINSKLHDLWKRNAWTLVPTQLDAVLKRLTTANQRWQEAVAIDRFAGRDLDVSICPLALVQTRSFNNTSFNNTNDAVQFRSFQFSWMTYEFVVLEEDEFSNPEGSLLARTRAHHRAQQYTAQNHDGRLYCVADGVPFNAVSLPSRNIPDLVNPFLIVLSAATRFRRMLAVPEHLVELWAKLQAVMDAVFFKPVGWEDPSAHLAGAFLRMSEHGKSRRKPYRDAYMENVIRKRKEAPSWIVKGLRRSTGHQQLQPQQQRQRQEQQEPDGDGLWAVFLDRRAPARDRNLALFAVLGR